VLSAVQLTTGSACRLMPAANASDPAPFKSTVAAARLPTTLMTCSRTWHRAPSCRTALTAGQSALICDLCDHELLQTWLVRDSSAWCILFETVKMSAYKALQRVNVLLVASRSFSIHDTRTKQYKRQGSSPNRILLQMMMCLGAGLSLMS